MADEPTSDEVHGYVARLIDKNGTVYAVNEPWPHPHAIIRVRKEAVETLATLQTLYKNGGFDNLKEPDGKDVDGRGLYNTIRRSFLDRAKPKPVFVKVVAIQLGHDGISDGEPWNQAVVIGAVYDENGQKRTEGFTHQTEVLKLAAIDRYQWLLTETLAQSSVLEQVQTAVAKQRAIRADIARMLSKTATGDPDDEEEEEDEEEDDVPTPKPAPEGASADFVPTTS